MKSKKVLTGLSALILMVFFQNCGEGSFQGVNSVGKQIYLTSSLPSENIQIANVLSTSGNVYYVATTGVDGIDRGTLTKPFKTIAYAVSKMVAGDTTYVRGGLYNEKRITFGKSGTQAAPIRLLNYPGESPVIDFGVNHNNRVVQRLEIYAPNNVPVGWIVIEGFEIQNSFEGIKFINAFNVTVRRNRFHHGINQGIGGNGKNITFDRNVVYHNGSFESCAAGNLTSSGTSVCNQSHGLYITGPNWTITNNLIYDNLGYGIVMAGYKHCPEGGCYGNKIYADSTYGGASGWLVANNTIAYNNYRPGIVVWQSLATQSKIVNNIFYENSQKASGVQGINFSSSGGGHELRNNLCYASGAGGTSCINTSAGAGKFVASGNIDNSSHPKFVNAGSLLAGVPDFKLKADSPAINAGFLMSAIKVDFLGLARPRGGSYDIGAYEY